MDQNDIEKQIRYYDYASKSDLESSVDHLWISDYVFVSCVKMEMDDDHLSLDHNQRHWNHGMDGGHKKIAEQVWEMHAAENDFENTVETQPQDPAWKTAHLYFLVDVHAMNGTPANPFETLIA